LLFLKTDFELVTATNNENTNKKRILPDR